MCLKRKRKIQDLWLWSQKIRLQEAARLLVVARPRTALAGVIPRVPSTGTAAQTSRSIALSNQRPVMNV